MATRQTVMGDALPNIPWEDKPAGCHDVVWRYSGNPVIPRDPFPAANSVFNSAAIPYNGAFAGVFRVDHKDRCMYIHTGFSKDGIDWELDPEPIRFEGDDPEVTGFEYAYDPRVVKIEDKYYVMWCNGYHGPTIGLGWTRDFKTYHQLENAFLPYNRNGVLFPRTINGEYCMLSRPSDTGHTRFGDIFVSRSKDLEYWGKHRWIMGTKGGWQSTKVGGGPAPIETTEGWLMLYHGVLTSCNGYVYSYGAALLDIDEPWKVITRGRSYLMAPREIYETQGDVPNVTFPCATLVDAPTGRMAIYYGAADSVTGLAFTYVDDVIEYIRADCF